MAVCEEAFQIHSKSPYDDMWKKFSPSELMSAAAYKSRRGTLLPVGEAKIRDDALDAINFLVFAIVKLSSGKGESV